MLVSKCKLLVYQCYLEKNIKFPVTLNFKKFLKKYLLEKFIHLVNTYKPPKNAEEGSKY